MPCCVGHFALAMAAWVVVDVLWRLAHFGGRLPGVGTLWCARGMGLSLSGPTKQQASTASAEEGKPSTLWGAASSGGEAGAWLHNQHTKHLVLVLLLVTTVGLACDNHHKSSRSEKQKPPAAAGISALSVLLRFAAPACMAPSR